MIILVILMSLGLHIAVVHQDIGILARNGFIYDDSFYAFEIAKNIAHGNGMTFDGIHTTTGFQPLYVFLLVPVFFLAGSNLILPIYIALTFLALCTGLTTYLVYRISRRYVGFAASISAALIWSLSPVVIKQSANGLETAFASMVIALTAVYYLERVRSVSSPPASRFLALGLIMGAAVLSRLDGILLALAVTLDYLLLLRREKAHIRRAVPVFLLPAGILILYGPWMLVNIVESGTILQDSGTATRFLSLAYASYLDMSPSGLASSGPDLQFIWKHLVHSLSTMKVIPPVHVIFRSIDRVGTILNQRDALNLIGNFAGFVFLGLTGFQFFRWRKDRDRSRRLEVGFLLLFSGLILASYSFYIFGSFFYLRYYFPVYLIASIILAFLLQDIFEWYRRRSILIRRVALSAAAVYTGLFLYFSYSQSFRSRPVCPFYDIAAWIEENTAEDETIGVLHSGTIGYFSDRRIINLDGKVNPEALKALKEKRLSGYIQQEGLDLIIDHSRTLEIFLDLSPREIDEACARINCNSPSGPTGWIIYRPGLISSSLGSEYYSGPSYP